ncbi:MAG: transglutaminase domain-containing protein [Deltaproteobacteria bacterium]|nr:transglutaminase domain-containing protein [Deltaproteobacteria bacterium]MBW2041846.1 transglutaminase domain-containing protein [Deltaproteobacteria bacterium]MBW2133061.1 transglutaminase domain-containing protein [Deltaproteobacteria bacterium]
MKPYWIAGILFAAAFAGLMAVRLNLFVVPGQVPPAGLVALGERDTWMHIFQGDQKIGFSHSILKRDPAGYRLEQTVRMRLSTMGLVQDVTLSTRSRLNPDLSLFSFDFRMDSGRFRFEGKGIHEKGKLAVEMKGTGGARQMEIPVSGPVHPASVIYDAVIASGMKPGETRRFDVFDIASLGRTPVSVTMEGKEKIFLMGASRDVSKVTLDYKGMTQEAWISEEGEVLKEEGLLGMRLEKTDRYKAVSGIVSRPDRDLTHLASVPVDTPIENPKTRTRLAVKIDGVLAANLDLNGGRQRFYEKILVIEKERLPDLENASVATPLDAAYLYATPFIQSDHDRIRDLSLRITTVWDRPLEKARAIVDWIQENIQKKPVLSIPDALSVLENRSGDCNEHAVLFAALARAAGIPARVEAGLVYLKDGFYYHAWNLVDVGGWITVDALFNEIPADVTHIRLIRDAEKKQLDLLPVIGRIGITVVDE